jgi:predicted ATP-grasp superfamily ATP-dependent carboligase
MRELVKTGETVYAIGQGDDVGVYSRYGHKFEANSIGEFRAVIDRIINEHSDGQSVKTFIASSRYLDLILRKWPELWSMLNVIGPPLDLVRTLNRKTHAQELFARFGIPSPKTYLFEEYESIQDLPVIAKWDSNLHEQYENVVGKTTLIQTREELLRVVNWISELDEQIRDNLIFQEFISSSVHQVAYSGFWNQGKQKMGIVVEQKRQYPRGITSYAVECQCEVVHAKIEQVLSALNYTGFIEAEFLQERVSGSFYLLDINPRPWGYIKILRGKYSNFVQCVTEPWVIGEIEQAKVEFVDVHRDLMALIREQRKGFSPIQLIQGVAIAFKKSAVVNTFELDDMKPFVIGVTKAGFSKLRRREGPS